MQETWAWSLGWEDPLEKAKAATAAAKSLQSCQTLCDPTDSSPPGSPVPGILQARTRVGCHFLLQCMKEKSESEVTQSCLTLRDRMDCSPPGSTSMGFSRQEYWSGCHYLLWGIGYPLQYSWASLVAQLVKNLPAVQETWVQSLGWEDPLEKGQATHSSIPAWRIPWTV